jgi:CO/xanthine dehydrogenase FAD-binding subunit
MPVEVRIARTMAEAAGILSAERGARLLSGGTLVMRDVNEGRLTEGTLLRLLDPAYARIETGGARIEIGAGATMAAILARQELSFLHPAARAVGGPAVRNMATVGGNLFAPSPYGDLTVALLALDAQVLLATGYGQPRAASLEEFLSARDRGGQGLVAGVAFGRPSSPADLRFRKVSRVKPKGLAVLTIAALLPMAGGRVLQARVAFGAMGPAPLRARGVERAVEGRALDAATIAAAKAAALEGVRPATDAIASDWYRREVLPVHLGRLLAGEA